MLICDICGKHKVVGSSQQHKRGTAGKRWKKRAPRTSRTFYPNLQRKTVKFATGEKKQMKLCAKCIKRIKKFGSTKKYKSVNFV